MTGSGCYFSKLVGLTCCCSCSFAFEQRNTLFIPTLTLLLSYFLFSEWARQADPSFYGRVLTDLLDPCAHYFRRPSHLSAPSGTSISAPNNVGFYVCMYLYFCACFSEFDYNKYFPLRSWKNVRFRAPRVVFKIGGSNFSTSPLSVDLRRWNVQIYSVMFKRFSIQKSLVLMHLQALRLYWLWLSLAQAQR